MYNPDSGDDAQPGALCRHGSVTDVLLLASVSILLNTFTAVVVESFAYVYEGAGHTKLSRRDMRKFHLFISYSRILGLID